MFNQENKKSNKHGKQVIGYILTPKKDIYWYEKLIYYDSIEDYNILNKSNSLYNREIVDAINTKTNQIVKSYIYIRNNACEDNEIKDGDWLKR